MKNLEEHIIDQYVTEKRSLVFISEETRLSRYHVRKILVDNDIKIRSRSEQMKLNTNVSDGDIIELYAKHQSLKIVAELVGMSDKGVKHRLLQHDISIKNVPWNKGIKMSEEHSAKLSRLRKGVSWEERMGPKKAARHRKCVGKLISKAKMGYKHSPETISKLRKARIKQIREARCNGNQFFPSYNKNAIEIIDQFGNVNGFTFQHAENYGEYFVEGIGCWVDGYDKQQNVVVEVYEPHHYRSGILKKKDIRREQHIIDALKCTFYRIEIDNDNNIVSISRVNKLFTD